TRLVQRFPLPAAAEKAPPSFPVAQPHDVGLYRQDWTARRSQRQLLGSVSQYPSASGPVTKRHFRELATLQKGTAGMLRTRFRPNLGLRSSSPEYLQRMNANHR